MNWNGLQAILSLSSPGILLRVATFMRAPMIVLIVCSRAFVQGWFLVMSLSSAASPEVAMHDNKVCPAIEAERSWLKPEYIGARDRRETWCGISSRSAGRAWSWSCT
jgi:hypothetical protein